MFLNIIGKFLYLFLLLKINSRLCGEAVCGDCSMKKINENRVCDLCFYKAGNSRAEKRREDQLKAQKTMIKIYNKQLEKEKNTLNQLAKDKSALAKQVLFIIFNTTN